MAIREEVFDVGVNLRGDSKTYGEWYGEILSEDDKKQLYISPGFAHGFLCCAMRRKSHTSAPNSITARMKAESPKHVGSTSSWNNNLLCNCLLTQII